MLSPDDKKQINRRNPRSERPDARVYMYTYYCVSFLGMEKLFTTFVQLSR